MRARKRKMMEKRRFGGWVAGAELTLIDQQDGKQVLEAAERRRERSCGGLGNLWSGGVYA